MYFFEQWDKWGTFHKWRHHSRWGSYKNSHVTLSTSLTMVLMWDCMSTDVRSCIWVHYQLSRCGNEAESCDCLQIWRWGIVTWHALHAAILDTFTRHALQGTHFVDFTHVYQKVTVRCIVPFLLGKSPNKWYHLEEENPLITMVPITIRFACRFRVLSWFFYISSPK